MKAPKPVDTCSESTRAWRRNPGVIYFIAAGDPPLAVKIGMAALTGQRDLHATLVRRLSQIQSSNHELIRLLGVIVFDKGEYPTGDAEVKEENYTWSSITFVYLLPIGEAQNGSNGR